MIIPCEDQPPKRSRRPTPQSLLRAVEGHLEATRSVDQATANEAQQLVYDAWEAATDAREHELIRAALALDPTNVDALLALNRSSGPSGAAEIELLRNIVKLGEKKLGPTAFQATAGHFWMTVATRPYMRARAELAEALRWAGRLAEAVAEWEALLALNPNDNQGARYNLLACYLAQGRLAPARKLLRQYPGDCRYNTVFAWGKVLERFLAGDLAGAAKALRRARKQNPHTQGFITGQRRRPKFLPDGYTIGSLEEAVCFAEALGGAWRPHPAARAWLAEQP